MQLKESINHYYDGCLLNSLLDFPKMDCLQKYGTWVDNTVYVVQRNARW